MAGKWSELIALIMGEKDNIVTESVKQQTVEQLVPPTVTAPPTVTTQTDVQQLAQPAPNPQPNLPAENQQYTKAQFDALNAEVAKLKAANQQLILHGTLKEEPPEPTSEEIILSLCAGGKYGKQNS